MSRFAFGLRYFLFGLGSALNTGEHVTWSIDLTQDCPNLCRAVCAILITPTAGTCRSSRQLKRNFSAVTFATQSATKRTPPALPEIGREASATVCAPLVVSLPWRVTARCPIVDPDLAPGRSAIPVLVAAMVLTARRLLRFLVLGRSNSVLRLRRVRGRDRCLAGPRWVALGVSAGGEKCRIDAARRWSGAAAESNGSDCWAMVRHPNHARLAQLDGNTVAFGPGVADAGRLVRGGLRACDDG